jgi:hypothetical protein
MAESQVEWNVTGSIPEGPKLDAGGKICVESYSVKNITVTKGSPYLLDLAPGEDATVVAIKAGGNEGKDNYDNNPYLYLKYVFDYSEETSGSKKVPLDTPLILIGSVIKQIPWKKDIKFWYSPPDPPLSPSAPTCEKTQAEPAKPVPSVAISILIGSGKALVV